MRHKRFGTVCWPFYPFFLFSSFSQLFLRVHHHQFLVLSCQCQGSSSSRNDSCSSSSSSAIKLLFLLLLLLLLAVIASSSVLCFIMQTSFSFFPFSFFFSCFLSPSDGIVALSACLILHFLRSRPLHPENSKERLPQTSSGIQEHDFLFEH